MYTNLKTPRWMLWLIIVVMLPVFQFPLLLSGCSDSQPGTRTLVWIYPFYVLVSGYLAYICYPARREMSWILLILMVLSHLAVWALVNTAV